MASLKEIKARISSVKSTLKITQAMKMVASAKLRKAQRMVAGLDAYKSSLYAILSRLSRYTASSPLAQAHADTGKVAIVVFSSNTALCGSYNANIFRALESRIKELGKADLTAVVYPVGEKVARMARKAGYDVRSDYVASGDNLAYDDMAAMAQGFVDRFLEGGFSRVELLYMHFKSASRQSMSNPVFLPINASAEASEVVDDDVIIEPSEIEVVEKLLPLAMRTDMYATLLSSNASENACRLIAMQTASDNAQDLLQQLQLTYNKQRQQVITEELTDISNGKLG